MSVRFNGGGGGEGMPVCRLPMVESPHIHPFDFSTQTEGNKLAQVSALEVP